MTPASTCNLQKPCKECHAANKMSPERSLSLSLSRPTAFCKEPSKSGDGTSFIFSVYYDFEKDRCSPFFYTGEGGNENRFNNERECMRNCSPNAEEIYPMDGERNIYMERAGER